MKPITKHILSLIITAFTLSICYGHEDIKSVKFIENKGQWPKQVNFRADVNGGKIWLENNKISYQFTKFSDTHAKPTKTDEPFILQHVVWAEFVGANTNYEIEKRQQSKEYSNYFLGKDQSKWVSNAYGYSDIKYKNLYNNTDLRIYEKSGHLKYDFFLKAGAENNIQINYQGQDKININRRGELVIATTLGQVIEEKPYAYQIINGKEVEVKCSFSLKNDIVSFSLGKYNKSLDLIIDPVLVFASYSGSTADNFGMTATYGYDGSLFAGGTVFNNGFPTTPGAFDTVFHGAPASGITDIIITRYDPTGVSQIYSTYIGGTNTETVNSIIANENNELYIYGATSSSDFPTTLTAYDNSYNGGSPLSFPSNGTNFTNGTDIYVAKINALGTNLLGCTYVGGTGNDGVNYTVSQVYDTLMNNYSDQFRGEIMLDKDGDCYITSSTKSSNFPTLNAFDNTLNGHQDAVVFKLNTDLTTLKWSTYLGGSDADAGFSIKVDTNNIAYVCGGTTSNDFPVTTGTITTSFQGGKCDGYITKIDSNGSSILAATYIGTNSYDQTYFIEIDRFKTIYVVGQTEGAFPVINAPYSNPNSGSFIVSLDSNLTTIDYSTVFGNGSTSAPFCPSAFLVDRCQNVYVSGWGGDILTGANLTGMPTTANAFQPNSPNGFDFYLIVLERDIQSLLYGTYFGGATSREHVDGGTSRFDKEGVIYQSVCAGCGGNDDFPTTTGAWSNINNSSNCNNGVFKFDFEILPKAQFFVNQFQGCAPLSVTFTNTSNNSDTYLWDFGGGDTTSQVFHPSRVFNTPGTYNVSLLIRDSICNTVDTAFQTITVNPPLTISGGTTINTCDDTATFSISVNGTPIHITWSTNNQFTDTLNPGPLDTSLTVLTGDTSWYYVLATNGLCLDMDSFLIQHMGFEIDALGDTICLGDVGSLQATTNSNQTITYNWTPGGSIVSGGNTPAPTVNPGTTTTYYLTTQNSFGCSYTDSATVTVIPQITLSGGDTTTTCDTATLYISTTGPITSITWSTNNQFTDTLNINPMDSSLFVSPSDTMWYYVYAENSHCSAIDSFLVNYPGFDIIVDTGAICSGMNDTLNIRTTSQHTLTYSWTPLPLIISGANTSTPVVNPAVTTTYYVTVQNNFGCSIDDSSIVTVSGFNANNINVWSDKDTLYSGASTLLHVTPSTGFTFSWVPPLHLNNPTLSDPLATPIPPAVIDYTVTLKENSSGCDFRKSLRIYALELNCGEPDIFIPNAFTPNADGENDMLLVRGRTVEKMYLKIYNRWGELVFETDDQPIGWDGMYKGELVDPGVFVYHLEITCVDGQEYFKKGNVTVIR